MSSGKVIVASSLNYDVFGKKEAAICFPHKSRGNHKSVVCSSSESGTQITTNHYILILANMNTPIAGNRMGKNGLICVDVRNGQGKVRSIQHTFNNYSTHFF